MTSRAIRQEEALGPFRSTMAGAVREARDAALAPLRPFLREVGLTEQQWRALRVLADEGPMDASRLAASALLLAPSITRILRELDERGLLERVVDPADGRRVIVTLTASGRALVRETACRMLPEFDRQTERFGSKRMEKLLVELNAFVAAIEPFAGQAGL